MPLSAELFFCLAVVVLGLKVSVISKILTNLCYGTVSSKRVGTVQSLTSRSGKFLYEKADRKQNTSPSDDWEMM